MKLFLLVPSQATMKVGGLGGGGLTVGEGLYMVVASQRVLPRISGK